MLHFQCSFFCVSNIITKKSKMDKSISLALFLHGSVFRLSNIVILLLRVLEPALFIELQDRRGEVLCLLSCLSFNKVGPPSSRRGTRQPTFMEDDAKV